MLMWLVVAVLWSMCTVSAAAQETVPKLPQLRVQPELGTSFGKSDFALSFSQPDASGQEIHGRSLLEWPVDFVLLGVSLGLDVRAQNPSHRWVLGARVTTNVGDARGTMDDSDYVSAAGVPESKFAFTKSDTSSTALFGELSLGYRFGVASARVTVLAGYRHEHYGLSALGAEGYYPDQNATRAPVHLPSYIVGAKYRANHALPFVGFALAPSAGALELNLQARVYYLYDRSVDDHMLRGKEGIGTTHGFGSSFAFAPTLRVSEQVALGLAGELYWYRGFTGTLKQSFYRNDPDTPQDEREAVIPPSTFHVETLRLDLSLFLRVVI